VARRLHYRGYVIKCYPEPVAVSGQWRLRIAIYTKTNGIFELQPFVGPTVYANEDEVRVLSIAYGQRIIDEKVLGLKSKLTTPMVRMR
jgi:hypothetical protein